MTYSKFPHFQLREILPMTVRVGRSKSRCGLTDPNGGKQRKREQERERECKFRFHFWWLLLVVAQF